METIKRIAWLSLIVVGVLLLTSSALAALSSEEGPASQPPASPQDVQVIQASAESNPRLEANLKKARPGDQALLPQVRLPQTAGPKATPTHFDPLTSDAVQLDALTPSAPQITCQGNHEMWSQILWGGNFEQVSDLWYVYSLGPTGTLDPGYDFSFAYQGNGSIVVTGTPSANFWVEQEMIYFPERINRAELNFYLHRDNVDPGDKTYAVFYDNVSFNILAWTEVSFTAQANQWQSFQINLDSVAEALAGRRPAMYFLFTTDEDTTTTTFHIDNVAVELCSPAPPCVEIINNGAFSEGKPPLWWEISGTAYLDDVNYHSPPYGLGIGWKTPSKILQPIEDAGFEDGMFAPWLTSGSPQLDYGNVYSGSQAAHLGGYEYADDQVWQQVAIPAEAVTITMEAMYNLSTTEMVTESDHFYFFISDPLSNTNYYVVRHTDFGASGAMSWTQESYTLSQTEVDSIAGKTVNFGFQVVNNGDFPSEAWVDDTALHIHTRSGEIFPESKVWQTAALIAGRKIIELNFWLYTDSTHDTNDLFYVSLYNSDFSELLWQVEPLYNPGQWREISYHLPVTYLAPVTSSTIVTLNLAFMVENNDIAPHSSYWIDDVHLQGCPEAPHLMNDYLRVDTHPKLNGQYVIGTTGGDPASTNDTDKRLISGFNPDGYSWPLASFDTLRIMSGTEALDYKLNTTPPIRSSDVWGDKLTTKWRIKGFEVTQTIALVDSPFSGKADTALIHYEIVNRGSQEREVGLRSMLDVKIGENDGAPYFVPGYGNLIHETEFVDEQVPHYWKAFESATFDPAYLKGQGILDGGDAVRPNRFLIARWVELYNTPWDYTVDTGAVVTADSAVALYWTPAMLFPGETTELATYYGLGSGGGSTWLDAPSEVACDNLEFQVVLWVNNTQSSNLTGGISTLTLPAGLSLAEDTVTKTWPTIAPGEARSVNWWVAASGDQTQTLALAASTDFSAGPTLTPSSIQIKTPGCEAAPLKPPTQVQAAPGKTSIGLTWEPSESPEVSGYNIYRSTQAASGFVKISNVPVQATTYEDKDPTLTKTVPAYYYHLTSLASSNESEASNIASATFGEIKLFIPKVYGPRNSTAIVPINITNADGLQIASQDVYINYPADLLQVAGISRTVLTLDGGYAYDFNITQPGMVRIALASGTSGQPLHGEGTLFQVRFSVIGSEGLSGDLGFQPPPDTAIYSPDDLVNPIPLMLQSGAFRVQKNYILGDLSGDGAVKSNDAALALRVAVGKLMPTPEQYTAGDVNGDQRINSADVALIMRMAVGLNPLPTATEQASAMALRGRQVIMSIPNQSGNQGGTIKAPINLSDAAQVAGGDLIVNYDPNLLEAKVASLGELTTGKNFVLETNTATPGVLRVSLAQSQGSGTPGLPAGAGQLLELEFFVKRNAPNTTTDLTISGARLNDLFSRDFATSALEVTINTTNGRVVIGGGGPAANNVYLPVLLKNIN